MKKVLPVLAVVLIFVLGLGIMLYPTIANYVNARSQTVAIDHYEEAARANAAYYEGLLEQAQAFNREIFENGGLVNLTDGQKAAYETLLNLNGDGVISYVMFKGQEDNQEAIARTKYGQENADAKLVAAGKPALKFYDESNAQKYLVDQAGTWSRQVAQDYMTTILAQYNMDAGNMVELVIANNDEMALGAMQALQQAGYNNGEGTTTIPVFGVDATADAVAAIDAGTMAGTIKQDAEGMAEAIATIAANMIAGKDMYEGLNENFTVENDWKVVIPYAVYTGN